MSLNSSSDLTDTLQKLYETTLKVSKHKKLLNKTIIDFDKRIYPLEFESYYDYFKLKSFNKGFSESGVVDLDEVRHKDRPLYYTKLMKKDKKNQDKPTSSSRSRNSLEDKEKSADSTLETSNSTTIGKRRSTRLNNTEDRSKIKEDNEIENNNNNNHNNINNNNKAGEESTVLRLPEDVIPKVVNPIRRSDVILPPKDRYVRERQPAIKPESNRLIKYSSFVNMPNIKKSIQKCSKGEYKRKK